ALRLPPFDRSQDVAAVVVRPRGSAHTDRAARRERPAEPRGRDVRHGDDAASTGTQHTRRPLGRVWTTAPKHLGRTDARKIAVEAHSCSAEHGTTTMCGARPAPHA